MVQIGPETTVTGSVKYQVRSEGTRNMSLKSETKCDQSADIWANNEHDQCPWIYFVMSSEESQTIVLRIRGTNLVKTLLAHLEHLTRTQMD